MNASAYRRRWNFTSQADFETRMKVADAAREKQQAARDAAAAWKPRFGVGDVIEVSGASVRIESLGAHLLGASLPERRLDASCRDRHDRARARVLPDASRLHGRAR